MPNQIFIVVNIICCLIIAVVSILPAIQEYNPYRYNFFFVLLSKMILIRIWVDHRVLFKQDFLHFTRLI